MAVVGCFQKTEAVKPDEQNADETSTEQTENSTKPKKVGSLALFCRKVVEIRF